MHPHNLLFLVDADSRSFGWCIVRGANNVRIAFFCRSHAATVKLVLSLVDLASGCT